MLVNKTIPLIYLIYVIFIFVPPFYHNSANSRRFDLTPSWHGFWPTTRERIALMSHTSSMKALGTEAARNLRLAHKTVNWGSHISIDLKYEQLCHLADQEQSSKVIHPLTANFGLTSPQRWPQTSSKLYTVQIHNQS